MTGNSPPEEKREAVGIVAAMAADKRRQRPRDAASIILIDRSAPAPRVLMGKRSSKHVFMPDTYVFPGGRRDREDNRAAFAADLHPETQRQLNVQLGSNAAGRIRGLAICALRELFEETGICAGGDRFHPDLSILRYVARAITPPGRIRRYDTHFFACFADELGAAPDQIKDSDELTDLRFVEISPEVDISMPRITKCIMAELHAVVASSPSLAFGSAIPTYRTRRGQEFREFIKESRD